MSEPDTEREAPTPCPVCGDCDPEVPCGHAGTPTDADREKRYPGFLGWARDTAPCPWCHTAENLRVHDSGPCCYVTCARCGGSGPDIEFDAHGGDDCTEAKRLWNDRAPPTGKPRPA